MRLEPRGDRHPGSMASAAGWGEAFTSRLRSSARSAKDSTMWDENHGVGIGEHGFHQLAGDQFDRLPHEILSVSASLDQGR
jgi:hypothetical protein